MISIRPEQDKLLSNSLISEFATESLSFLREKASKWTQDQDDEQMFEFIDEMIIFAQTHFVFHDHNIQQLMLYKIEFNFDLPLSDYKQMLLGRQDFGENYRVNQFYLTLISNNDLIRITLDSDIQDEGMRT